MHGLMFIFFNPITLFALLFFAFSGRMGTGAWGRVN